MVRLAPVGGYRTSISEGNQEPEVRFFTKLYLVLWKNLIYCRRHWILLLAQLVFTILAMSGFVVFHNIWNLPVNSTSVSSPTIELPTPLLNSVVRHAPMANEKSKPEATETEPEPEEQDGFKVLLLTNENNRTRKNGKNKNVTKKSRTKSDNKKKQHLYYFPQTDFVDNIMQFVQLNWQDDSDLVVIPVANEDNIEVNSVAADVGHNDEFLGGVVFKLDNVEEPKLLKLRLRLRKNREGDAWETATLLPRRRVREPTPQYAEAYKTSHFLVLQHLIALQFTELTSQYSRSGAKIQMKMQPFPFPPYYKKGLFIFIHEVLLPLAIILSYVGIIYLLIKNTVEERHTGVKDVMNMSGLATWIQLFGWFICCFTLLLIISCIVVAVLCIPFSHEAVLNASRPDVFALVMLFYIISTLFFGFFISCFFDSQALASGVGIIIWFLSYFVPVNILYPKYDDLELYEKLLVCVFPNMILVWVMKILSLFENEGVGLQWDNIFSPAAGDEDLTLALLLIAFVFNALLYAALFAIVVVARPGRYEITNPWYFILIVVVVSAALNICGFIGFIVLQRDPDAVMRDIESPASNGSEEVIEVFKAKRFTWLPWVRVEQTHSLHMQSPFETEPSGIKACITTRNIAKRYGWIHRHTLAVDDVSLKVYERQVTALLGTEGAGKSTLLLMIAGIVRPTSGAAFIEGRNMWLERSKAHRIVSICPKHNMLFPALTVKEHLYFFAKLKGAKEAGAKIEKMLYKFNLYVNSKKVVADLSIGTQRKVHLAIAFIGNAKVVILDEPTARVDPDSRRVIWNFLQEIQQEYCILLTTHYMEEADILGNRVAIMAKGKILCHGTSHFLKDRYGSGFYLHVLKGGSIRVNKVVRLVRQFTTHASLDRETCTELSFTLPSHSTWPIPDLFDALTKKREHLGIIGFGVSGTTMKEVYYAATKKVTPKPMQVKFGVSTHASPAAATTSPSISPTTCRSPAASPTPSSSTTAVLTDVVVNQPPSFSRLYFVNAFKHWYALLAKKMHYMKHQWFFVLCQLLLPAVLILYLLQVAATRMPVKAEHWPRVMNVSQYEDSLTVLYDYEGTTASMASHYRNLFPPHFILEHQDNVEGTLLNYGKHSFQEYRTQFVVAATFDVTVTEEKVFTICAMYNMLHVHSAPISLSLVHNALLADFYNGPPPRPRIIVENAPLPRQPCLDFEAKIKIIQILTVFFSVLALGLCAVSATFLITVTHERTSGFKFLQLQTGITSLSYWANILLVDALVYLGSAIIAFTIIVSVALSQKLYIVWDGILLSHVVLMIVLYGWCALPFTYLVSFLGGSLPVFFFCLLLGFNFVSALSLNPLLYELSSVNDIPTEVQICFIWLFRFLPPYCLMRSLQHISAIGVGNQWCDCDEATMKLICRQNVDDKVAPCCKGIAKRHYLEWGTAPDFPPGSVSGIGPEVFMLIICGLFYILILIFLDGNLIRKLRVSLPQRPFTSASDPSSSDIVMEEKRVAEAVIHGSLDEAVFLAHKLCKVYGINKIGVHDVSFGIKRGECLGLLGVSGAGKTSVLRMLAGSTPVSRGKAVLVKVSDKPYTVNFFSHLGYCPQSNGLLHNLTGRETLHLFARLHGYDMNAINDRVAEFISALALVEQADHLISDYSLDAKRKLSVAIAYMGDADVVLLDEPTTGLLPEDKRKIWEIILQSKRHGTSVLLASKSIEECELLCDRMAIMVEGKFLCIGKIRELKKKFGEGITLTFHMSEKDALQLQHLQFHLEDFIDKRFKDYSLRVISQSASVFNIPKESQVSWRHVFTVLDEAIGQFPLTDYSVSEASLEQIMHSFTTYSPEEIPMNWEPH